jgi:hypothetical protein
MFDPLAFVATTDLSAAACSCTCSCNGGAGAGGGAGSGGTDDSGKDPAAP